MLDVGIFTHLSRFCVVRCCHLSPCRRMKHNTPVQSHHAVEFSLRICERSAGTSTTVVTTVCQFCEVFGKEESVVGGIAVVWTASSTPIRPRTSTVESNFLVAKYKKNRNCMSLIDASLEGILHANQYRHMCSLGSESSLNTVRIKIHNNAVFN